MFRFLAIFLSASSAAAVGESIRSFSNHHHRLSPQTPRCSPNHGAGDSSLCGSRGVRLSSEAPAANAGAAAFPATVKCARQAPSVNRFHHPRPVTTLARISHTRPDEVAHALAVSRLFSTRWWGTDSLSSPGVGMSADAARTSACATSSPPNVCEKRGLVGPPRTRNLFQISGLPPAASYLAESLAE
jgi:hypothetical protein